MFNWKSQQLNQQHVDDLRKQAERAQLARQLRENAAESKAFRVMDDVQKAKMPTSLDLLTLDTARMLNA